LLAVNSPEELAYVRELLEGESRYMRWWTGGFKDKSTDTWFWDGEAL
jgi:hypothetical protein